MVRLLHYSDVENAYDDPERIGRLAGAIAQRRNDETLVLGTGDNTGPGALSLATRGAQSLPFFAAVEPDAETFGNHDFDYGPSRTLELAERSPQPWLTSNVFDGADRFGSPDVTAPAIERNVDGMSVGLIGVTDPSTPEMCPPAAELRFEEPIDHVERQCARLDTDYVVVLSHVGGLDEEIARRTPVDAVLGGIDSFSYWTASRVVPGTINEFPLFAWLNGDLHAHMMGMPFLLLGAALAFALYRTPPRDLRRRRVLAFLAVPLLAGLQTVVDTWSTPSLFGLLFLAVALGSADPWPILSRRMAAWRRALDDGPLADELGRLVGALGVAGVAGVLGGALAFPFLLGTASGREVAILAAAERTSLPSLVLVHGAFLVTFYAYLLDRLSVDRVLPLLVGVAALGLLAATANLAVSVAVGPLLVFGWVACRTDRPVGFETVLIVAGAGLVGIVELLYVKEQAGPLRMNTVFKTYMQVWVLWGTAAGAALPAFVRWAGGSGSSSLPGTRSRWLRAGLAVAVVLATVPYAGLALSTHFAGPAEPTLDATRFVERDHPDEAPAITYVDDLPGQPTLLSAPATGRYPGPDGEYPTPPGMYSWDSSPAASLTGVPTVAGWGHEIGYRGTEPYLERVRDVDDAYTGSPERTVAVLERYDVEYVWVGPAERARYGSVTFGSVDGLTPVFQNGAVTIYRVDESELGVA